MTIFLTGASGLTGSAFARAAARRGHTVTGVVGTFPGDVEGVSRRLALDLAQDAAVTAAVLDAFPEVIVNCAALSEPAVCEAEPGRAQALNVALPAALARLAHHVSARLVHISSEQVFDGARRQPPYARDDVPAPINLYGRQKRASEQAVLAAAPDFAAIVRAPLLLGDSPGGRRGLHERLFADWAAGRTPRLYTDEFRQPCTAENLAEVLLELVERPALRGVFHWAGTELVSRYALGQRVREHFKLTEASAPLAAVTRADTPAVAASRPPCLALDLSPLAGELKTRPSALAEHLAGLKVPPPYRDWYFEQPADAAR
jgi:dTDP-4-dehydrorhamnose reductase